MAEISITPKKYSKTLPTLMEKTKSEARERKRNVLYLILGYLLEQRLDLTAETLQNEAQLNEQYQICENIDLDIILQEYQSYYHTKFQKYPKILRKMEESEISAIAKARKRSTAKPRKQENKDKTVNHSETEDFQFEITSLTNGDKSSESHEIMDSEKAKKNLENMNFEGYSSEWREMALQIVKEFIPRNLGIYWSQCIGLHNTIEKLKEATVYPAIYPDLFKNVTTWQGVLLHGPPGTGKTLLAKALATEGFTTVINVTSSTFISKWRGDSEKMIKVLFDVARHFAPTTIYIDEVDALASTTASTNHEATRRFKSELLTQIDGIRSCESDIFILGSTNEPWNLDAALLRRFEKRILVNLPNESCRLELLQHYIGQPNTLQKEEFRHLAELTDRFSGSDIKNLCKEVSLALIREKIKDISVNNTNKTNTVLRKITHKDMVLALEKIKPCTTIFECQKYCDWNKKYGSW